MVRRMTGPDAKSATALATETGVSQQTLSRWLRSAGTVAQMGESDDRAGRRPQDWSADEILAVITEAAGLSDQDLGAFLRRKGLHEAHLETWRARMMAGLETPVRRSGRSPEAKRIKELERELRRKEKALAELAALLVLQKKLREIWGDEEDDTKPRSGA
jgi:transposase-like protein